MRKLPLQIKLIKTLLRYSELLQAIEEREWNSELLRDIQQKLNTSEPVAASKQIHHAFAYFRIAGKSAKRHGRDSL